VPLVTAKKFYWYGNPSSQDRPLSYCVNNTSASDYGKCYNIIAGKAVFVQTDTTTWPIDPSTGSDSFPCATDGTCIRYTTVTDNRILGTIFDYPGKQAILQYFWSRSHASRRFVGNIQYLDLFPVPVASGYPAYLWLFPATNYEVSSWPVYDPVGNWKAYVNPYTITVGYVNILRWQGNVFTSSATLGVYEGYWNNIWYAFDMVVTWAYESSPLAIIPLDYDKEWLPYQELRSAFGYADTGVDQPGWNADDIIRVLRELFPDRAWAVFDDRKYVLYLYNLSPDYVPDWLVEKLSPTAMKVLQPPADVAVAKAWLDLLNERNAQIPPQAELP
jgi:hypothetical protein